MSRQKVMWTYEDWRDGGYPLHSAMHVEDYVSVLVTELDPNDLPPEWAMEPGTEVEHRAGDYTATVGKGDVHRDASGRWCFCGTDGLVYGCHNYRPIPPTETLTLRVTGSREDVEAVRSAAKRDGVGTVLVAAGLSVEVVEDPTDTEGTP